MKEGYRPDNKYWFKVWKIEQALFAQTRPVRDLPGTLFYEKRIFKWNDEDSSYGYAVSTRKGGTLPSLAVLVVGPDLQKKEPTDICVFRAIFFKPYSHWPSARDYRHMLTVQDLEEPDRLSQSKLIVGVDRIKQRLYGTSIPTKETYDFLLDALKKGEDTTR